MVKDKNKNQDQEKRESEIMFPPQQVEAVQAMPAAAAAANSGAATHHDTFGDAIDRDDASADNSGNNRRTKSSAVPHAYSRFHIKLVPDVLQVLGPVEELPDEHRGTLGPVLVLVSVGIFLVLFFFSYVAEIKSRYLSPLEGHNADKMCESIAVSNSGVFLMSDDGYWEGDDAFRYSRAKYSFTAKNLVVDFEGYKRGMSMVYNLLTYCGAAARVSTIETNVLMWMSFTVLPSDSASQRFALVGSPLKIFDRQNIFANIGGVDSFCSASARMNFNTENGIVTTTYETAEYFSDTNCTSSLPPMLLGIWPGVDFKIHFDIRSLITALSINRKILSIPQLVRLESAAITNITLGDKTFFGSTFYDPKYTGMKPIACMWQGELAEPTFEMCVLQLGSLFSFPVLHHVGEELYKPHECSCDGFNRSAGDETNCDSFNFMTGFIFWPSSSGSESLSDGFMSAPLEFALTTEVTQHGQRGIRGNSYNATYATSEIAPHSSVSDLLFTSEYRKMAYDFCYTPSGGYCSMMVFSHFDLVPMVDSQAVSHTFYDLIGAHCADTLSPDTLAWTRLVDNPRFSLVQGYQTCKNDPLNALVNAMGVTTGVLQIVIPLLLSLLYIYIKFAHWAKTRAQETTTSIKRHFSVIHSSVAPVNIKNAPADSGDGAATTAAGGNGSSSSSRTGGTHFKERYYDHTERNEYDILEQAEEVAAARGGGGGGGAAGTIDTKVETST